VVFDDKKGCTLFDKAMEKSDQEGDIVEVESGGRLVEDQKWRGRGGWRRTLFLATVLGSCGFLLLGGEMGDEFESLSFSARKLTEGLATAEVAESDLAQEGERLADLLVTFPSPRSEVVAGGKVDQRFGCGHFEELID
jgi:hypothetical protein